ncbi:lipoprotein [Spiroplasma endosymbiont of Glossina fuscipes fuscipes]|uniref:lipoprotein n=1 Tax=Spiroplasma endosymbiont of Glossina fuscipes fuscipes TaxID=2004463 RepID=UPI003C74212B
MKKWLSILGIIELTATSTTSLISCKKPNNNKNGESNNPEPKPDPKQEKPQEPPIGSNWKLIPNWQDEISNWQEENNKKTYIGIIKIEAGWTVIKWIGKDLDYKYQYKSIYRWDGVGEPKTFEINNTTGEITDWKE